MMNLTPEQSELIAKLPPGQFLRMVDGDKAYYLIPRKLYMRYKDELTKGASTPNEEKS